jgi:hypothetical protein
MRSMIRSIVFSMALALLLAPIPVYSQGGFSPFSPPPAPSAPSMPSPIGQAGNVLGSDNSTYQFQAVPATTDGLFIHIASCDDNATHHPPSALTKIYTNVVDTGRSFVDNDTTQCHWFVPANFSTGGDLTVWLQGWTDDNWTTSDAGKIVSFQITTSAAGDAESAPAFGSAATISKTLTGYTAKQVWVSSTSTISGLAAGDLVTLKLTRYPATATKGVYLSRILYRFPRSNY